MKLTELPITPLDLIDYRVNIPKDRRVRIGIVVARFNEAITSALLKGALTFFNEKSVITRDISITYVPGAFELPVMAKQVIQSDKVDAVLCLGCVIRGDTAHFDYVAGECARGIMDVQLSETIPVIFGVLTTDTVAQALERCQADSSNKGYECAEAAYEMACLKPIG